MMRLISISIWFLLFTCPAFAARNNIVLFVADDHGQDAGCYGNPVIKTPNLDSLARGGTLFTNAFATTASCSASRSVILTGLYNHRTGQYGHQHDYHHFVSFPDVRSLPVLLSEAGYRTASVGKYHVAPEEVYHFDEYIPGSSRNPVEMADNCRSFVEQNLERPFFLYFCTSDPHRGGGVIEESPEKPDRFGNRPEGYPGIQPVRYDPKDVIVPPFLPDTAATRAELAQYYQSVSRLDQGLGRLIELLKSAGVFEDTLVIYISDHGMAFPGAKTTVYEPGLRSPCIVRHPNAKTRGLVNSALVNWTDLTPTILDFAGVQQPEYEAHVGLGLIRSQMPDRHRLHGRSFLSIIEQENAEGWDETYASHTFHEIQMYYPMRVVRTNEYKLIWNIAHPLPFPFASDLWAAATWQSTYQKGPHAKYGVRTVEEYIYRPRYELYAIQDDPWEEKNLADAPGYQKILKAMKEKLRGFQIRTSDPWLLKWDYE
jgi:N-sulfoglucosamine sulfohydrolase